jgi:hypothetical protein
MSELPPITLIFGSVNLNIPNYSEIKEAYVIKSYWTEMLFAIIRCAYDNKHNDPERTFEFYVSRNDYREFMGEDFGEPGGGSVDIKAKLLEARQAMERLNNSAKSARFRK